MEKDKILQVNTSSSLGGGPQVMWDIVKGLKDSFSFVILAPKGEFLKKYKSKDIPAKALAGSFLRKIKIVRRQIKKEKPSIVHVHGTRAAFWARPAIIGLKNKPKVVYTLHGFHIIRRSFFMKWPLVLAEKFLNYWTDVLVCVSGADKELVKKYNEISEEKIRMIKNGIDLSEFDISKRRIKKEKEKLDIESNFVVTSIARLHPQKDVSTLIKALAKVMKQINNNIKLLIIGNGPLREKLEQKVRDLSLSKHVDFLGFRKDTPLLINFSNVVVLSTNWEGLPLVPLEAGASKKPIIGSDVGGISEVIKDKETGFLFEKGDAKDLTDKLRKLYESEELRKNLGQNAYQFVSENFSKKRMIKEYKKLYNEITQAT